MAVPIAASFIVTRVTSDLLWRPAGVMGMLAFILQVATVGSTTALLVDRSMRRFLPLAALFNMTLVFPDRAPSRFGIALRAGSMRKMRELIERQHLRSHQDAAEFIVTLVASVGRHDRLTRGHTERVRAYSDLIAQELDLPMRDRQLLSWGAMIHDVGKLTVSPDVLNLPGRPDDDQWNQLRGHPGAGANIVAPLANWLAPWHLAASEHHERWDGKGYPNGLAGTDISLAGRIVGVADAYDVITSTRSYKKAMSHEAARREMVRCSGTQFDPTIVRALLHASLNQNRSQLGVIGWLSELADLAFIPQGAGHVATATVTAAVVTAAAAGLGPTLPGLDDVEPEPETAAAVPHAERERVLAFAGPRRSSIQPFAPEPTGSGDAVASGASTDRAGVGPSDAQAPPPVDPDPVNSAQDSGDATDWEPPTLVAPEGLWWNLGSGGAEQAVLPLAGAPEAGALPNYSPDRGHHGGLLLFAPTASEAQPDDSTALQVWSVPFAGSIFGVPTLDLWVSTDHYDITRLAHLDISLHDCGAARLDCEDLGTTEVSFDQADVGRGFAWLHIELPTLKRQFGPDRHFMLTVRALDDSNDLVLAYDTVHYPSRLVIVGDGP
ncbi:MAG: HD-GYP domain-containing protein [Actinomycetota bacterium]